MSVQGLHHVAYRCRDAQETADFYTRYLHLPFKMAFAENRVPSTKEWSPHVHIFFQMANGSYIAFFELPESDPLTHDPNTPTWVQHLALEVPDLDTLAQYQRDLEADGIEVVGPTDHGFCRSIYFFDPNGHRLELTVDTATPAMLARLEDETAPTMEHWNEHKSAGDADFGWLHSGEANESK